MNENYSLGDAFRTALADFQDYLPDLALALGLLLIGWAAAHLLRALTLRVAHVLDQVLRRASRQVDIPLAPPGWSRLAGNVVFWLVMLFAITFATRILGLTLFASWLDRMADYVPTLLSGALIILVGFLASALARDLVTATAPIDPSQRLLLGRLTQAMILLVAVVIGIEQIGINVTFLVVIIAVLIATVVGGVALAVSLGARTFVANLVATHSLRQTYQIGSRIRIANHEGKVIEFTPTSVVLETSEGRVNLPARIFFDLPAVLLEPRDSNGPN